MRSQYEFYLFNITTNSAVSKVFQINLTIIIQNGFFAKKMLIFLSGAYSIYSDAKTPPVGARK
jgi:hypothetical protein